MSSWSNADGVGRLRMEDGSEVRVGRSACNFDPVVGQDVSIDQLAPHPLGGHRALGVRLLVAGDADDAYDAVAPLPGLTIGPSTVAQFEELGQDIGLFGVVVREPIRSRKELRAWLTRAGADVDFSRPGLTIAKWAGITTRVELLMTPMHAEDGPSAAGIVLFAYDTTFSLETERKLRIAACRVDANARAGWWPRLQGIVHLVLRCAEPELAVIMYQAAGATLPAAQWCNLIRAAGGDPPLEAITAVTLAEDRSRADLYGLSVLGLPDLVVGAPLPDQPHDVRQLLVAAAWHIVRADRPPFIGEHFASCETIFETENLAQLEWQPRS